MYRTYGAAAGKQREQETRCFTFNIAVAITAEVEKEQINKNS